MKVQKVRFYCERAKTQAKLKNLLIFKYKELRASFTFPYFTLGQCSFLYAHLLTELKQTLGQEHLQFIRKRWKAAF